MSNLKTVFLAAILTIGGMTVANAQISQGSVLKVNIPNSFVLADTTFAAGKYTIERTPSTTDSPSLLILRGKSDSVIFDTIAETSGAPAKSTQLVFDKVDGTYFLSQIWIKGATAANEIPISRSQRQMIARGPVHKVVITTETGF